MSLGKAHNMKHEPIQQVVAGTPPVAVAGLTFLGTPIADWVQLLALVWLVLQIGFFVHGKWKNRGKSNEQGK